MKYFFLLVIIGVLTGCADNHQLLRAGDQSIKLNSSKSVYISIPRDEKYGQINYQGSGVNASQIILMAFSKHCNVVETGHQYQSFENALAYSSKNKFDYLVYPTILEWEDRATEWSAIPDRVSIKIAIINVETEKTLNSAVVKGTSGIATLGGDHPQDLLPKPVGEYIDGLY